MTVGLGGILRKHYLQDKWHHVAVTRSGNSFDIMLMELEDAITVTNSGAFSDAMFHI